MELAVQAAKRMADRRWGERLGNDFEGNQKMFWKEVKRVRKGEDGKGCSWSNIARWRRGEKEMGRVF